MKSWLLGRSTCCPSADGRRCGTGTPSKCRPAAHAGAQRGVRVVAGGNAGLHDPVASVAVRPVVAGAGNDERTVALRVGDALRPAVAGSGHTVRAGPARAVVARVQEQHHSGEVGHARDAGAVGTDLDRMTASSPRPGWARRARRLPPSSTRASVLRSFLREGAGVGRARRRRRPSASGRSCRPEASSCRRPEAWSCRQPEASWCRRRGRRRCRQPAAWSYRPPEASDPRCRSPSVSASHRRPSREHPLLRRSVPPR